MSQTITVTCDGCGKDLSSTSIEYDFRLLTNDRIPLCRGPVSEFPNSPELRDAPHHFCDTTCLKIWVDRGCKNLN